MRFKLFVEMQKKVMPPILVFSSIILEIIAYYINLPTLRWYLFLAALIMGIILFIAPAIILKYHNTSYKHHEDPTKLLTTGIFAYSKNPIYLGMLMVLIAIAIQFFSLMSVVLCCMFYYIINTYYIPKEEEVLKKVFGVEYTNYSERTPTWI